MVSLTKYQSSIPYITVDGQIWSVNADPEKGYTIYTKQMKEIIKQVNIMCHKYRRVFWTVFDLHMPQGKYTVDNKIISDFLHHFFRIVKSKYRVKDIGYSWCREMEKAKQQHYHFMMMLDGKAINWPDTFFNLASEAWILAHGEAAHAYMPKNCFGKITDNKLELKQELIFRVSYQAKGRGKGYRDKQAKDYSTSRIKPRQMLSITKSFEG